MRLKFLSTLSLRRATWRALQPKPDIPISIHALLAESDDIQYTANHCRRVFLSTLSLRRATCPKHNLPLAYHISIHALLAESDLTQGVFNLFANPDFYPRSPCGERQIQEAPFAV